MEQCVEPKQFHHIVGYYNRFNVFDLVIDRRRLNPATFRDAASAERIASRSRGELA